MSNYINVLRRLERERRVPEAPLASAAPAVAPKPVEPPPPTAAAPAAPAPTPITVPESVLPAPAPRTVIPLPSVAQPVLPVSAPPAAPEARTPVDVPATRQDPRRSRAFATETHPGIALLLDKIRTLPSERPSRMVVFSGASRAEAVASLAEDLASHARRTGLNAFVGTLSRTAGGTIVTATHGSATHDTRPLEVDLDAGAPTTELSNWVEQVAPSSDLAVITGPPLATSLDAALLACACDGLVIIAESEVTERAALQIAAERARIAGCRTLGVVMHGTKDRLPKWLRRLVGDQPEPHLAREE